MANEYDIIRLKKHPSENFDWQLFLVTVMMMSFGLISIYSATYDAGMSGYFFKQLIFSGIGLILMLIIMFLPEKWMLLYSYIFYGFILILLIAVLIFGTTVYGTKGWFQFAGISVQPSEFAIISTLLIIAQYLSRKGTDIRTIRDIGIVLMLTFIPAILIMLEPDIGSATVLFAMMLGIMFWTGFDIMILFFAGSLPIVFVMSLIGPVYFVASVSLYSIIVVLFKKKILKTFATILIIFAVGYSSPILINKIMPHQKDRIETFLNPDKDPLGKGYNVIQSKLAVGNGGMFGKGFLQGTQTQLRYIPKQWTDFIFCVPAEEFGFLGGGLVVVLLMWLIFRATRIAYIVDNKFFSIVAFGAASVFFYHTIINVGMVLGLMPVMGIPLPFMSYGGSSLIVNVMMVGLLLNAFRTYRQIKIKK